MVVTLVAVNRGGGAAGTLRGRVAALDEAVGLARGRLPDTTLEAPAAVVARARDRAALSGEYTVVALAGATGSGKSSLLNALAGARIAEPGVRRPTTGHPVAVIVPAVGAGSEHGADELLDWLDVRDRHVGASRVLQESATGLVLLDLPDHDSVVTEHRTIAERLYERVDLLVWVVDPQKYADAALHARYLRGLRDHAGVVVLVLNQADRLTPAEQRAMVADLQRLATEDGLGASPVLAVSASTGAGVTELRDLLARAAQRRLAATERVTGDVRQAARALVDACGSPPDARREVGAAAALVRAWESAAGVDEVADAVRRSTKRSARAATGWPVTRWVARLRPDPLRRLGLGRERVQAGQDDLLRSSRPAPAAGERSAALSAVRSYVDAATSGAPDHWVLAARSRAADVQPRRRAGPDRRARARRERAGAVDLAGARVPPVAAARRGGRRARLAPPARRARLAPASASGDALLVGVPRTHRAPARRGAGRVAGGRARLGAGHPRGTAAGGPGAPTPRCVGGAGGERPRHRAGGRGDGRAGPVPDRGGEGGGLTAPRIERMTRLEIPVQLRWSDMDAYQHVNNVEMLRLLEEARIEAFWSHPVGPDGSRVESAFPTAVIDAGPAAEVSTLVARQEIEYLQAAGLPPHTGHRRDVAGAPRRRQPGRLLRGAGPRVTSVPSAVVYARALTTLVLVEQRHGVAATHRPGARARRGRAYVEEPVTIRRRR